MQNPFRGIEAKTGVHEYGYEVPNDEPDDGGVSREWGDALTGTEVFASIVLPISGVGFAIWRFGRGNIGPGFANVLLFLVCTFVWALILKLITGAQG